jgi:hypothetical protein
MRKKDKRINRRPILRRALVSLLAMGALGSTAVRAWAQIYGGTTCPSSCSGSTQYIGLSCGTTYYYGDGCPPYHYTAHTDVYRVDQQVSNSQNCKGAYLYTVVDSTPCTHVIT